ncbi:MAG: leader peptidase (prepilin peptidase) / N-methyltransferase [Candidatus Berkelbacteria bacterium Licking1014_85]|uniref:Leader peptidase (Prepilin peptidase) / N-methyltransferase n=1 Tax=Candidatus Berkelbacteria bacterium Licking1014_85 TaxID=2017148 RepID=A0A554LJ32_9BACT|nr:MAG: leader peptidase (prepilin peptidase) / N-methyltransferase [Candidatus Berkelbacteria bacterium Licking1014_85]
MPEVLILVLIFFACASVASFTYTLAERRAEKRKSKYSACHNCRKHLKWFELIPVISFLIQFGKCRKCKSKIPVRYLIFELMFGAIGVLLWSYNNSILHNTYYIILTTILLYILYFDILTLEISETSLLVLLGLIILGFIIPLDQFDLLDQLSGLLLPAVFLGLLYFFSQKQLLGFGDIELSAILGFWLGFRLSVLMLFLAFILGGIIASILLLIKVKKVTDPVAFAPFLIIASLIAFFWGEKILNYFYL